MNIYYMKGETVETCNTPRNATWVIRKIIDSRKIVMQAPGLQVNLFARLELLTVGAKCSIKNYM